MIQIIPENRRPSTGERLNRAFGTGLNILDEQQQKQAQQLQMHQENETLKQMTGLDFSGIRDPKVRLKAFEMAQQGQQQKELLGLKGQQKQDFLSQVFGGQGGGQSPQDMMGAAQQGQQQGMLPQGFDASSITDAQIAQASTVDPNIGRSLQHSKDVALREKRAASKADQSKFEHERSYHSNFSKEADKEADLMRSSLPRKEMALDFARNAVETGDLSYFSPDKLADATGIDLFRTAKGSQLVTAAKENLLGNMGRVSSRAQNMWFEQRLNSMFPKIGQSREANLTAQEMLESEAAMDKAYLSEYDRLASQDEEKYGFVRKDIKKRAQDAANPIQKEIFQRSTYRMKEVEEQEKGLTSLKKSVGKNVVKGTPLTLSMAKLYKDKFGENAQDVAKKNGYYIPTLEEFKSFQARPEEFREQVTQ